MQDQKALLDSMMGRDRNCGKHDGGAKRQNWWDDDLCKKYLAWECPHAMFLNGRGIASTKSPVGDCGKEHLEAMKTRFEAAKGEKGHEKYRRRYLVDLEKQMRQLIEGIDAKIVRESERLEKGESRTKDAQAYVLTEIETRTTLAKDKMLAAEEMAANGEVSVAQDIYDASLTMEHEKKRLERLKEKTEGWIDEICKTCGAYMSWRDAEEIKNRNAGQPHPHVAGVVHTGWTRMRKSFEALKAEISSWEELPEEPDEAESSKGQGRRERRRDPDRGRDDAPARNSHSSRDRTQDDSKRRDRNDRDTEDTSRHRDRDDSRRRDRDDRGGRRGDRDDGGGRARDDRERRRSRDRGEGRGSDRTRDRDREGGRRNERDDRGRKKEKVELDEFGRDVNALKGKDWDAQDTRNERSRSRARAEARAKAFQKEDKIANEHVVQVEHSEDWEQVMEGKFEALALDQDAWDMTAYDRKEKVIKMDAEVVEINRDSFPLQFKFNRKEPIVQVPFSEDWEDVMAQKFEELALEQDAWDMSCADRKGKKIDLNAEQVQIVEDSFPLKFTFKKKLAGILG